MYYCQEGKYTVSDCNNKYHYVNIRLIQIVKLNQGCIRFFIGYGTDLYLFFNMIQGVKFWLCNHDVRTSEFIFVERSSRCFVNALATSVCTTLISCCTRDNYEYAY